MQQLDLFWKPKTWNKITQSCLHYRCGQTCVLFRFRPWTITSGPAVCSVMRISFKVTVLLNHTVSFSLSALNLISPSLCVSVRLPPSFPCESRLWKYLECTQFTGTGRQVGVAFSLSHLSTGVCKGWWREATHTQRRLCLHTHTHTHTHIHGFTW